MIYRKLTHIPQKKQKKNKIHQYIPRTHTHTLATVQSVCSFERERKSLSQTGSGHHCTAWPTDFPVSSFRRSVAHCFTKAGAAPTAGNRELILKV